MTITEKIMNNCKKGLITIVKNNNEDYMYMAFSNHKDCNGNYRVSCCYGTIKEAKQCIGEGGGYSEEDIEKIAKKYNWEIVEVFREEVEPFKVGDKVKILPSIENASDWEDYKKYYPNMEGRIWKVLDNMNGLCYGVYQEDGVDYWTIDHKYLAPLYEEVEEEVIEIGDKRYNKCEVEKALKNIKPL